MRRREWLVALAATCGLGLVVLVSSAMAQTAPKPAAAAPPAAATAPAGGAAPSPSRTTASFGDWTLRCDRQADATPPKRSCELGLTVQHAGDQSVLAQVAVGRPAAGEPLRFTAVLPANISVAHRAQAARRRQGRGRGRSRLGALPAGRLHRHGRRQRRPGAQAESRRRGRPARLSRRGRSRDQAADLVARLRRGLRGARQRSRELKRKHHLPSQLIRGHYAASHPSPRGDGASEFGPTNACYRPAPSGEPVTCRFWWIARVKDAR